MRPGAVWAAAWATGSAAALVAALLAPPEARAGTQAGQTADDGLTRGIHHYRLDNGLDLVVAVRPGQRLAAVNLTVNLGSSDDPPELSGIAHVLEHMTLSGSVRIGSLDVEAEGPALEAVDRAFRELIEARDADAAAPPAIAELERRFDRAHAAARATAEEGEIMGGRLEARGAIGLNATTSADVTQYFAWLPSSALELWISLEAERLRWPIFRRFYSEREVILQEVAALGGGRATLRELVLETARPNGPRVQPFAGDPKEIAGIDRRQALEHFARYYRPENITLSIVGDVDPQAVFDLCRRYFSPWRPAAARHPLPSHPPLAEGLQVGRFNSVRAPIVLMTFPQPSDPGPPRHSMPWPS